MLTRVKRALLRKLDDHVMRLLSERPQVFGPPERFTCLGGPINNALIVTNSGNVTVMEGAFFGYEVALLAGRHDPDRIGAERSSYPADGCDIVVERGAWIGSRVTVLGPARIGAHAVVAAGSLVLGDVPPGAIVAGSPATVRRQVEDYELDGPPTPAAELAAVRREMIADQVEMVRGVGGDGPAGLVEERLFDQWHKIRPPD